jgi:hypothetical protein
MAARARIDDGGKVPGKIVAVTSGVLQGKSKGNLHRDLRSPDEFAVSPWLTINRPGSMSETEQQLSTNFSGFESSTFHFQTLGVRSAPDENFTVSQIEGRTIAPSSTSKTEIHAWI